MQYKDKLPEKMQSANASAGDADIQKKVFFSVNEAAGAGQPIFPFKEQYDAQDVWQDHEQALITILIFLAFLLLVLMFGW